MPVLLCLWLVAWVAAAAEPAGAEPAGAETACEDCDPINNQVIAAVKASRLGEAETLLLERLDKIIAARGEEHAEVGKALYLVATLASVRGNLTGAEARYRRALGIFERTVGPEAPDVAKTIAKLAGVQRRLGHYPAAAEMTARAVALAEGAGPEAMRAALVQHMSLLHDVGDYAQALALAEQIMALGVDGRAGKDRTLYAVALQSAGEPRRATALLESVLRDQRAAPLAAELSTATYMQNLASNHTLLGRYPEAAALYEQVLEIRLRTHGEDHQDVALTLGHMALLSYARGDYAEGLAHAQRAAAIHDRIEALEPTRAKGLSIVANGHKGLGDYAAAREALEAAAALRRGTLPDGHPEIATGLDNLGLVLRELGHFDEARGMHLQAHRMRREALGDDHRHVAVSLINLGTLAWTQGDLASARTLYAEALGILEGRLGVDHPDVAKVRAHHAALLFASGDLAEARGEAERALSVTTKVLGSEHPDVAGILDQLGEVQLALGDTEAAGRHFGRAMQVRVNALGDQHPTVATSVQRQGDVALARGDAAEAVGHYRDALTRQTVARGEAHPAASGAAVGLAKAEWAAGGTDAARQTMARALALQAQTIELVLPGLSERQQLALLASRRRVQDVAMSLPHEPDTVDALYQTLLRTRTLSRHALRSRRAAAAEGTVAAGLASELAVVERSIARLVLVGGEAEALEQATWQKDALERQLADATGHRLPETPEPAELCAALPSQTALVDIVHYRHGAPNDEDVPSYAAFVLAKPACQVSRVDLGAAQAIDRDIERHRRHIEGMASQGTIDAVGVRLRQQVWDPLRPALGASDAVGVVVDGGVAQLALSALPVGPDRYLLEDVAIGYLDGAADVVARPVTPGHGALVVGGVAYGGGAAATRSTGCIDRAYTALPGAATEATELAALLRRRTADAVVHLGGASATEPTVAAAAEGKRWVHLATHGFFASGACRAALSDRFAAQGYADIVGYNPMVLSGMVLARAEGHDGLWTAQEVASLRLVGTELVVLSGCETGRGDVAEGQGVLGLRRALAVAGARSVVMSLWRVPDDATSVLMAGMYRGLTRARGAGSPVQALREAQLAMLARSRARGQGPALHRWAAFVATGPPGT